jgi:hypothetical protein
MKLNFVALKKFLGTALQKIKSCLLQKTRFWQQPQKFFETKIFGTEPDVFWQKVISLVPFFPQQQKDREKNPKQRSFLKQSLRTTLSQTEFENQLGFFGFWKKGGFLVSQLDILFIFLSFIYGNLLIVNSPKLTWNIVSIFKLIFLLEFLSLSHYFIWCRWIALSKQQKQSFWLCSIFSHRQETLELEKSCWASKKILGFLIQSCQGVFGNANGLFLIKRGILLGIFIEAFKVGS